MKIYYSFIALFFFINAYGQDYPKMVVEGATWIYQHEYNNYNSYNFHVYHINGDTFVNGVEYSIIYLQDFNLDSLGFLSLSPTGSKAALMREDTLNRKVYTTILDENILTYGVGGFEAFFEMGEYENEVLLYDFSLDEGDTLASPNFDYTIFDIEFVERFSYGVQKFSLDGGNDYFEKFGGEYELFAQLNLAFVSGGAPSLIHYCVTDNFECEYFVGVNEVIDLVAEDYSIFPNPTNGITTFKLFDKKIQSIQLFSATGKLLWTKDNINSNEVTIDLSTLDYTGLVTAVGLGNNSRFVGRMLLLDN